MSEERAPTHLVLGALLGLGLGLLPLELELVRLLRRRVLDLGLVHSRLGGRLLPGRVRDLWSVGK